MGEACWHYSAGTFTSPRGPQLHTHAWAPTGVSQPCRVFVLHGYGAHGAFPTVRLLSEHLASCGIRVHSFDLEGCGRSDGLAGLLSPPSAVTDSLAFAAWVCREDAAPCFFAGTSLGGGLALKVALAAGASSVRVAGLMLLSPLVVVPDSSRPPPLLLSLLRGLCVVAPWAALVGNTGVSDADKQYADPEMRELCVNDALSYHGKMRLGTAAALLELTETLQHELPLITLPLVVVHGSEDAVVRIESSRRLMESAGSKDKTFFEIVGAVHSLLCEPPATRARVLAHISDWLLPRAAAVAAGTVGAAGLSVVCV